MNNKTQLELIQEAYFGVITEGKEAKFKVGDKVGIGRWGNISYLPNDTGTVKKVSSHGKHTVEFDNRKSSDNPDQKYTEVFDHTGGSTRDINQSLAHKIIPLEDHNKHIKDAQDKNERKNDLNSIGDLLNGHRNGFGHYSKLSKEHAAHIKSLLDKHTEE